MNKNIVLVIILIAGTCQAADKGAGASQEPQGVHIPTRQLSRTQTSRHLIQAATKEIVDATRFFEVGSVPADSFVPPVEPQRAQSGPAAPASRARRNVPQIGLVALDTTDLARAQDVLNRRWQLLHEFQATAGDWRTNEDDLPLNAQEVDDIAFQVRMLTEHAIALRKLQDKAKRSKQKSAHTERVGKTPSPTNVIVGALTSMASKGAGAGNDQGGY